MIIRMGCLIIGTALAYSQTIAEIPTDVEVRGPIVVSPDFSAAAFQASKNGKAFVMSGKKVGEEFEEVGDPVFSPDSKYFAYPARQSKKWIVVLDAPSNLRKYLRRISPGDSDRIDSLMFSPDGTLIAFRISTGEKLFACLAFSESTGTGIRKSEPFDYVSPPIFCEHGKQAGYGARNGSELWWKTFTLCEHTPCFADKMLATVPSRYDSYGDPLFCKNGKIAAFRASYGLESFLITNYRKWKSFAYISDASFCPNMTFSTHIARDGSKSLLVMIGATIGITNGTFCSYTFSADSEEVAFTTREDGKYRVTVAGETSEEFDYAGAPLFGPDNKRAVFFCQKEGKSHVAYGKERIQIDCENAWNFVIDKSGESVRYVELKGGAIKEASAKLPR